jgi:hypothetical protein
MGEGMGQVELPAAIDAQELQWTMTSGEHVLCYHRPGAGRPVLLLHSINAAPSAYEVSPFFDAMTLQRPLYAPDLPGFGRSERRDRVYSPAFFADAIIDMLRAIDAGPSMLSPFRPLRSLPPVRRRQGAGAFQLPYLISPTGFTRRRDSPSTVGPRVHRVLTLPFLGAGSTAPCEPGPACVTSSNMGFRSGPEAMVDYACRTSAQPGASHAPFYFLSGSFSTRMPWAIFTCHLSCRCWCSTIRTRTSVSIFCLRFSRVGRTGRRCRIPETLGLPHFEKPAQTYEAIESFWARL